MAFGNGRAQRGTMFPFLIGVSKPKRESDTIVVCKNMYVNWEYDIVDIHDPHAFVNMNIIGRHMYKHWAFNATFCNYTVGRVH